MTEKELEQVLQEGQGHKVEFKRTPSKLDRDIVGFANAAGGRIFIGIDNNGFVEGVDIDDNLKSHIRQIAENCHPPVEVTLEEWENVLIVHVREGWMKPHRFSAGYYLRNGLTSQRLTREELLRILQIEGKIRFDEVMLPHFDFYTHFDKAKFDRVARMAEIPAGTDIDTILQNLHVAEAQNGQLLFNNTGVLFFARNLAEFYYHTAIDCVLYEGRERNRVLAKRSNNEDILSAIDGALDFIKENVQVKDTVSDAPGESGAPALPYRAMREVIVNAVTHRNYFEKGLNTKIEIFDDRILVTNPGGLPAGLSEEQFGIGSQHRNPNIADLMRKIGYMSGTGRGIRKIQQQFQKAGLPPVQFEFNQNFTVRMQTPIPVITQREPAAPEEPAAPSTPAPPRRKKPAPEAAPPEPSTTRSDFSERFGEKFGLTGEPLERKIAILDQVIKGQSLDYDAIEGHFDVSHKTIKRDLKALKDLDLIEFVGAPKTGKYVLTEHGRKVIEKL
ncbi:MAG TPA: ATP-binding protein [bacterium]|nr:ATP-binding protein [bacterium]